MRHETLQYATILSTCSFTILFLQETIEYQKVSINCFTRVCKRTKFLLPLPGKKTVPYCKVFPYRDSQKKRAKERKRDNIHTFIIPGNRD